MLQESSIQVSTSIIKRIYEVDFEVVAVAVRGIAVIPEDCAERFAQFIKDKGLVTTPFVLMEAYWNTPHWNGSREWTMEDNLTKCPELFGTEFVQRPDGTSVESDGIYVFTNATVKSILFESRETGSVIRATKKYNGLWTLSLEVPMTDDGEPCVDDEYWKRFHKAIG
ncbi:MAG: hypothetical protein WCV85_04275 [Patescibacteria group bacterium]